MPVTLRDQDIEPGRLRSSLAPTHEPYLPHHRHHLAGQAIHQVPSLVLPAYRLPHRWPYLHRHRLVGLRQRFHLSLYRCCQVRRQRVHPMGLELTSRFGPVHRPLDRQVIPRVLGCEQGTPRLLLSALAVTLDLSRIQPVSIDIEELFL